MLLEVSDLKEYNELKFCPVCGKSLEIHPISGDKACFLHGDFVTKSVDGKFVTVFVRINI